MTVATTQPARVRAVALGTDDVEIERRFDGSLRLRSPHSLSAYPDRLTERLAHWAREAPERTFLAQRAGISGRREPGEPREHALEVARRVTRRAGQLRQRQRGFGRLDRLDRAQHGLLVARDVVGQAALARPQAGVPRFRAAGKEADVGAGRMPRPLPGVADAAIYRPARNLRRGRMGGLA